MFPYMKIIIGNTTTTTNNNNNNNSLQHQAAWGQHSYALGAR